MSRKHTNRPNAVTPQAANAVPEQDIDAELANMVTQQVSEKADMFDEKLKYWRSEVDQTMLIRFEQLNTSVLGQLS